MDRDDTLPLMIGLATAFAYLGAVSLGYIDFRPGALEGLLVLMWGALGYDSWTDRAKELTDDIEDALED